MKKSTLVGMKRLLLVLLLLFPAQGWGAFVYDSFSTGAESSTLESRAGETGATWTKHPYSTFGMKQSFGRIWGGKLYYASGVPSSADYSVECDMYVKNATVDNGIVARLDTSVFTGYVLKYVSASQLWQLARYVNGTPTAFGTTQSQVLSTWSTYHVKMSVETVDASTVRVKAYVDGYLILTWDDTSASRITATGVAGMWDNSGATSTTHIHRDNFEAKALPAGPDSIRLYDFAVKQVVQRVGTSANVSVRGTYNGAPTTIEARIVQHGTSTEVVTWTALSNLTMANGYFSGILSVPQGGWYNVQVRFSNSTSVVSNGSNQVGIGAVIALAGQSNIGNWSLYTDVTPNDLISRFKAASNGWTSATGNGMSSCGNLIVSTSSIPVAFLDYGISGSSMAQWLGTTTNTPTYLLLHGVHDTGGILEAFFWSQGENEAKTDTGDAEGNYYANLATLFDYYRSQTSTSLKIHISLQGIGTATDYPYTQAIRNAQIRRCSDANTYCITMTDLAKTDIHYTNASYSVNGKRMAQSVLYQAGAVAYYQGPSITYEKTDSTHIKINITHRGGTDITPSSNYTGWTVKDDGVAATISTISKVSSSELQITLSSPLVGSETVYYLDGQFPTISGAVKDNTTITESLVATVDGLVPLYVPSQPQPNIGTYKLNFGFNFKF